MARGVVARGVVARGVVARGVVARCAATALVLVAIAGCSNDDAASDTGSSSLSTVGDAPAVTGTPATPATETPTTAPPATASGRATTSSTTPGAGESAAPSSTTPGGASPARLDTTLDADGFARQLSAEHATIVDPATPLELRSQAGEQFQLLLRALSDQPDLDDAVIAAVDPAARATVERIVRARQFLQARSASRPARPLPDQLPAWTVAEPEPVDTLLAHYAAAEAETGIPWYWLAAIHLQETRMGRIAGVSSAGAVGPMQFLPTTWASCCVGDPTNNRDAIIGAATYLAQSGGPDDMSAAVYQYNPNDGYVAVVTAYAETLRDRPELYPGYHAFQVFYGSSAGTVRLPVGYSQPAAIDAATHLAANPDDAA